MGSHTQGQCTLYVHDPSGTLPEPPAYQNPSFYLFRASRAVSPPSSGSHSRSQSHSDMRAGHERQRERRSHGRGKGRAREEHEAGFVAAKHRKDFEKFHNENGVRTVLGSIGPVENGG